MNAALRVLLLIALAPGFLAPGGLALRVCLCGGLWNLLSEGDHPSCGERPVASRSHCSEEFEAHDPRVGLAEPAHGSSHCRCVTLTTQERPPAPQPPSSGSDAPQIPALLPREIEVVTPRELFASPGRLPFERPPDPPSSRRNLPLVI